MTSNGYKVDEKGKTSRDSGVEVQNSTAKMRERKREPIKRPRNNTEKKKLVEQNYCTSPATPLRPRRRYDTTPDSRGKKI